MAAVKSPRPTPSTIAVVITWVWPWMLPPTTVAAPTSETACPKPAIAAASSGMRASSHRRTTVWRRLAPRPRSWSGSSGGSDCRAAIVIPAIRGVAIRTCAMTIPRKV